MLFYCIEIFRRRGEREHIYNHDVMMPILCFDNVVVVLQRGGRIEGTSLQSRSAAKGHNFRRNFIH